MGKLNKRGRKLLKCQSTMSVIGGHQRRAKAKESLVLYIIIVITCSIITDVLD